MFAVAVVISQFTMHAVPAETSKPPFASATVAQQIPVASSDATTIAVSLSHNVCVTVKPEPYGLSETTQALFCALNPEPHSQLPLVFTDAPDGQSHDVPFHCPAKSPDTHAVAAPLPSPPPDSFLMHLPSVNVCVSGHVHVPFDHVPATSPPVVHALYAFSCAVLQHHFTPDISTGSLSQVQFWTLSPQAHCVISGSSVPPPDSVLMQPPLPLDSYNASHLQAY